MDTVIVFIVLVVLKAAFYTVHPYISVVGLASRAIDGQSNVLVVFNRPAHVHDHKLKGTGSCCSNVKVEPDVVAVGVDVVRNKQVIKASLFTFEYAVQISALEFRRKL